MANEAVVHVIDDDVAVRESLAFLLASDGLPVRLHESASAFLDAVQEAATGLHRHRCAHAGHDGLEFLRRLKARGFAPAGHRHHRPWRRAAGGRGHEGRAPSTSSRSRSTTTSSSPRSGQPWRARPAAPSRRPDRRAFGHGSKRSPSASAGAGGPRRRQGQQGDRLRPRHQPAHRRDLPRQRHDQDAGRQPVRAGSHGPSGGSRKPFGDERPLKAFLNRVGADLEAYQAVGPVLE